MKNLLKSLFKKKEDTSLPTIMFHGVIAASKKFDWGMREKENCINNFISENIIYGNMYFRWDILRDIISNGITGYDWKAYIGPMYLYEVEITPKTDAALNFLREKCDTIGIAPIDSDYKKEISIRISDELGDSFVKRIKPGIENMRELQLAVKIGYTRMFNNVIIPKYAEKLKDADFNPDIIDRILDNPNIERIFDIIDAYYKNGKDWKYRMTLKLFQYLAYSEIHKN